MLIYVNPSIVLNGKKLAKASSKREGCSFFSKTRKDKMIHLLQPGLFAFHSHHLFHSSHRAKQNAGRAERFPRQLPPFTSSQVQRFRTHFSERRTCKLSDVVLLILVDKYDYAHGQSDVQYPKRDE